MANTYTQLHVHSIIIVRNRKCLIHTDWQDELYQYITGIIQGQGHKLLQINGMPDHVHLLIGQRPVQSLSRLMQAIKHNSTIWINEKKFIDYHFSWQSGYGAFSLSKADVPSLIKYIQDQKEHHRKKTFMVEYLELLEKWNVEYDDRYLFKSIL